MKNYGEIKINTLNEKVNDIITKTHLDISNNMKLHFIDVTKYDEIKIKTSIDTHIFEFKSRKTHKCSYLSFYGRDHNDELCGWCIICNTKKRDINIEYYWYFPNRESRRRSALRCAEDTIDAHEYELINENQSTDEDAFIHNMIGLTKLCFS